MKPMTSGHLITVDELEERLGNPSLVVVDCRFSLLEPDKGRADYADGHIPGAVHAHLDRDLAAPVRPDSGRHPLPDARRFERTLRGWGISNDSEVVAYDDASGGLAARLWWMLRWMGHSGVAVLNGGFDAWLAAGLPVQKRIPRPEPGSFRGDPDRSMIIDVDELQQRLADDAGHVLVDARDRARFLGEEEPLDAVAGHVPGALNLPFSATVCGGTIRDEGELRKIWDQLLGGPMPGDWSVMCGSGVTACHLALTAACADLPPPRLYAGSWSEWIRDPSRPVARGDG